MSVLQLYFTTSKITGKACELLDGLEGEWTKYNSMYGEEAYMQGFEDGVQTAAEKRIRPEGSVLSVEDMVHLIYMYDAVKNLNQSMLGCWEPHGGEDGILRALDRVYPVIEHGVCAEIRLSGEDGEEYLFNILDNTKMTPEERAEKLT